MKLEFDPFTAPPNSKWVPPTWVTNSRHRRYRPDLQRTRDSWDPLDPRFRGIDLKKTDPRLKIPSIEIKTMENIPLSHLPTSISSTRQAHRPTSVTC
ncbi:hypothetical protein C8J57DRAFT_532502 [Mycena rebaudengoi]|nr:hypothetical protein C8J57DRAFT_532502 [Mycena rebaudengoi]